MACERTRLGLMALQAVSLYLWGCGGSAEQTLWSRDFSGQPERQEAPLTRTITGYWEGETVAGSVRLKIEAAQITVALKCGNNAVMTSQSSTAIVMKTDAPKIVLENDLSGDRSGCGFLFAKGNEFAYSWTEQGRLKMNFAGTSIAELKKLSELERAR